MLWIQSATKAACPRSCFSTARPIAAGCERHRRAPRCERHPQGQAIVRYCTQLATTYVWNQPVGLRLDAVSAQKSAGSRGALGVIGEESYEQNDLVGSSRLCHRLVETRDYRVCISYSSACRCYTSGGIEPSWLPQQAYSCLFAAREAAFGRW